MGMDIWRRQLLKRSTAVIVMLVILCLLVSCGDAGRTNTGEDASTGAGTDTGTGAGNGTGTDIPPVIDTGMPDGTDDPGTSDGPGEPQETGKDADVPGDAEDTQIPVNPGGQQEAGLDPDNADQEASGMNAVDRIRDALKDNVSPAVTGELIRLFLDYQGESHGYKGPNHRYELRLLPEFGPGKTLDWDGLTAFIYYMANYFEHDEEGYYFFDAELFDETAGRLLPGLEYKHRRSMYFDYKNGIYKATGWDMHGGTYYRLKSISGDDRGTFTASFDGFHFYEFDDFGEPYGSVGENMKAMYDFVGDRNADADFHEVLLEILLREDYDEILNVNEHLEITFRISSDPEFAFEYLSCTREYLES